MQPAPSPITEIVAGTSRFWMHRQQGLVADAVSLIWASANELNSKRPTIAAGRFSTSPILP
jgi:hypothetical protein